ncbi:TnsD family Tn7-like transposition protein [Alteromonas sp. ASW11-36]|uniref:TnsD family Tn7-like transposition protein n=1 Tax=Alteromonas arenosi TaxID=3055817 RepID=A0ABT7T132_9ALTE|nr:TnsD family Tn7-like transposition protein [Alteromonas sp. ASW11-36]MDM7862161.1 TnsD family Tn7-like transposition protein [Alteromonas sp. ASW11-36]
MDSPRYAPFPDELLYSLLARIQVHYCRVSPKSFNEVMFGERSVSAPIAMPTNLKALSENLTGLPENPIQHLISHHSLFPLYAPFLPAQRRQNLIQSMTSGDCAGIHVRSGLVASRLSKIQTLRFCPTCSREQQQTYGEPYWARLAQIPAISHCPVHNVKYKSAQNTLFGLHRNTLFSAPVSGTQKQREDLSHHFSNTIAKQCSALLRYSNIKSPSYAQWTNYYRLIALQAGFRKGAYIDFVGIEESVSSTWSLGFLQKNNLNNTSAESSWLHSIFRKHRKSFSFLEHIVTLYSLLGDKFDIVASIEEASSQSKQLRETDSVRKEDPSESSNLLTFDQQNWVNLLNSHHPKKARSCHPALYARLFRSHHDWLIGINKKHLMVREPAKDRVNWRARDKMLAKKLLRCLSASCADLSLPRQTRRQLMFVLPLTSIIEKYSQKLPITNALLHKYSESVFEYQIRRITRTLLFSEHPYRFKRWFLLRNSGLSDERLTPLARLFIDTVIPEMIPPFSFEVI